jgi:hypothetical protein
VIASRIPTDSIYGVHARIILRRRQIAHQRLVARPGLPTDCSGHAYDPTMTIVTTRPRKRPAKPARAATIKVPRIVQHTPKGQAWKLPPDDPENAVAFLSRVIRPRSGS